MPDSPLEKQVNLEWCARRVAVDSVPGHFVKASVALGGSAIVLGQHLTPESVPDGYDVFAMIPPHSERDEDESHERYRIIASGKSRGIDRDRYYGYPDDLYECVVASFRAYELELGERIRLQSGLFEDILHPCGSLALVHIDSD